MSSVGRLPHGGRQKRMTITNRLGKAQEVRVMYQRMATFFNDLKTAAPQLTPQAWWERILAKALEAFSTKFQVKQARLLPAPS